MSQQDVHDELRARLHEAAEAHEPDRARVLARIERGMTAQDRPGHRATLPPVFGWIRVVGATAAVAAVLGFGGYAVASAVKPTPTEKTVAVSPTPSGSPDATSRPPSRSAAPPPPATPSTSASSRASSTPSSSPKATATAPVATGEQDGPLWSDGSVDPHSNDFWAQSDVTLKTTGRLTSLTVRLKVAQTGGVSNAGAWRSLPETDFTQTVAEQDGFLVYTWTLKPGSGVAVGEWVFAGQYNHKQGGRDAGDDSYTITGTAGGKQYAVTGDFATHTTTDGDS
ncbi:hypothetical protein [Streptomyces arenae]|uniref:hypothetical protein n=1 Tax=Streptomyces arenae TaxID=29301 RepID=UPI00265B1266|nr:hypothetical protein [Streptomyces arenae]MCG7210701.1 hypothetical protein [Streptomyces arenae]